MDSQVHEATFGARVRRNVLRALWHGTGKVGAGKRRRTLARLELTYAPTLQDLDVDITEIRQLLTDAAASASGVAERVAAVDAAKEQLKILRNLWHTELEKLNAQHRAAVKKAEREKLARRAEMTDDDGRGKQRQLVDVVLARERRPGGNYASIVTTNAETPP